LVGDASMNKDVPFIFNGKNYYTGTIIEIKEELQQHVNFSLKLQYIGYITEKKTYYFSSLYDNWQVYNIPKEQLCMYIKNILYEGKIENKNQTLDPKYIDGIVSAWIWYILIMFFSLFFRGVENIIITWCVATFIFFSWRSKKIKGG
jgi:hypothetical protein